MKLLLSVACLLASSMMFSQRGLPAKAEEALSKLKEFEVFEDAKSKDGPYKHYIELKQALDPSVMFKLTMSEKEPMPLAYCFLSVLESGNKGAIRSIESQKSNRSKIKYKTKQGVKETEIYLWMIEKYKEYTAAGILPLDEVVENKLDTWHKNRSDQILMEEKVAGARK